uniref:Gsp_73 putative toxin n=1 Tax=Gemmula speciosa TaxID=439592 RepID=A0A098LXR0_GEMSP
MEFYMLLTVTLLLTSLVRIDAMAADHAERLTMEKKSILGIMISPRNACDNNCGYCTTHCQEDASSQACIDTCNYCVQNCLED